MLLHERGQLVQLRQVCQHSPHTPEGQAVNIQCSHQTQHSLPWGHQTVSKRGEPLPRSSSAGWYGTSWTVLADVHLLSCDVNAKQLEVDGTAGA